MTTWTIWAIRTFPILSVGRGAGPPIIVLDAGGGASTQTLTTTEFQRLVTNGYHLTVTVQGQSDAALMTITVTVNPRLDFPDETYSINVGSPRGDLSTTLEQPQRGVYDGQLPLPNFLLGTSVPVALSAKQVSFPDQWRLVGEWSLRLPAKRGIAGNDQIQVHEVGRPIAAGEPGILANGYDLVNHQIVVQARV